MNTNKLFTQRYSLQQFWRWYGHQVVGVVNGITFYKHIAHNTGKIPLCAVTKNGEVGKTIFYEIPSIEILTQLLT